MNVPNALRQIKRLLTHRRRPAQWTFVVVLLLGACVAAPASLPANAPVPPAVLPRLPAELTLTADAVLVDVAVDHTARRVYVGDSARTLYVLDADTLALLETRPDAGGYLTLDPVNGRLYAATGATYAPTPDAVRVVVLDTATGAELARIPGRWLSVDPAGGRLFVGDGLDYDTPTDAPGIRILDAADFAPRSEIAQPGIPVFNPARDELLIVAYTVYTADPATRTVTGDLFPRLRDGIPFLFCNSCAWAEWARIFPEEGLIAVNIQSHSPQGSGPIAPPTWLDAATLAPVDPTRAPELYATCGSGGTLVGAVDGRLYRSRRYARYIVYNNLLVDDAAGDRITVRDGIYADYVDGATQRAYLSDGQVVALPALQPVGTWPAADCLLAADPEDGRLYAATDGTLRVIATGGGQATLLPPEPASLPAAPVLEILPSPAYADDGTLLLRSGEGRLYRSTDRGATWAWLRGGLPTHPDLTLGARFSPGYAADRTIFAFGYRRDYWGEGVLRSTDGGDTWTRRWHGLEHLRVQDLSVTAAPTGTLDLLATARFASATGGPAGYSQQQSQDGGATWQMVATAAQLRDLPAPPDAAPPLPVRAAQYDQALEVTVDGVNWMPASVTLEPDARVLAVVAAPDAPATLYVLTGRDVYRTPDAGMTWQRWDDARLAGRTYADELSALAAAQNATGAGHDLFVGTLAGEFWPLDPASMTWRDATASPPPVPTPTLTPSPPPVPTPTATPPLSTQEPPAGFFRPEGTFADMWAGDPGAQMLLGWARTPDAVPVRVVVQPFERGEMLWRADTGQIYARFDAMGWQLFPDTFVDGDPADDPALTPPPGLQQPVRGFGKVWREQPGVRDLLGWATAPEESRDARLQEFARGIAVQLGDRTLVLGATLDGTRGWSRR
ncbi:MAG: hypothetical protein H6644_10050 [Caldilineaceae bacterium]|nr:hypothetical protein [Caldilineaceae bacterium]